MRGLRSQLRILRRVPTDSVPRGLEHSRIHPLTHSPIRPARPRIHTSTQILVVVLFFTGALGVKAHDPITTKVTWSKEVVRIVDNHCIGCHMKDGVAPMPLTSYDEARPWAKAIKDEVVSRHMPLWPAARGFGHFSNDPTLSPFEIELIAAWVDGGAPKGDEKDLPAKNTQSAPSRLDLVLTLPARTSDPAGDTKIFVLTTPFDQDRWIRGWEFTPNDPAIVSAEFMLDETRVPLGSWAPPEGRVMFPTGAGQLLPHNQSVRVTIRYRSARLQQDFPVSLPVQPPSFALGLQNKPPQFSVFHAVIDRANLPTRTPYVLSPVEAQVIRASEEMAFAIRVDAGTPGAAIGVSAGSGTRPPAPLLWVRSFDSNYSPTYRLSVPVTGIRDISLSSTSSQSRIVIDYVRRY